MTKEKLKDKWKIIVAIIVAVLFVIYIAGVVFFSYHFLPQSKVNDMNISLNSLDNIQKKWNSYKLTIECRSGNSESFSKEFTGKEMGIEVSENGKIEKLLKNQNKFLWFIPKKNAYKIDEYAMVSEEKLDELISELTDSNEVKPQNAYIADYVAGTGYQIVPEVKGDILKVDDAKKAIKSAINSMSKKTDFSEMNCYEEPTVLQDDDKLNKNLEEMNKYAGVTITYTFGNEKEVLDGEQISDWISVTDNGVELSHDGVAAYVEELRKKHDTIFSDRKLMTSYGIEVTVCGGDYGWWMNTDEETAELENMIKSGQSGERTPVYYQKAASYGANDYGNTYVEINLAMQHMWFYQDGKSVLESDIVSGNPNKGRTTPDGTYAITYKERNATLTGPNYSTKVSYWMPFNQDIGLHDATWQPAFGGDLYLTRGSHGCINLPLNVAGTLYDYVEKGMPVFCYRLNVEPETTQPETPSETQPETQQETQAETQAETQPETQPETQAETQQETQAETQAEQ